MTHYYPTYIPNPYVSQNPFIDKTPDFSPLPNFTESRALLPQPYWDGHDPAIACYKGKRKRSITRQAAAGRLR